MIRYRNFTANANDWIPAGVNWCSAQSNLTEGDFENADVPDDDDDDDDCSGPVVMVQKQKPIILRPQALWQWCLKFQVVGAPTARAIFEFIESGNHRCSVQPPSNQMDGQFFPVIRENKHWFACSALNSPIDRMFVIPVYGCDLWMNREANYADEWALFGLGSSAKM